MFVTSSKKCYKIDKLVGLSCFCQFLNMACCDILEILDSDDIGILRINQPLLEKGVINSSLRFLY